MNDQYALGEKRRNDAYRAAFESPQGRAWLESLSADQRAKVVEGGLDRAYFEGICYDTPYDDSRDSVRDDVEAMRGVFRDLEAQPRKVKALMAAIKCRKYGSALIWAILRYLSGEGTCEYHAEQFGMTRQNFHVYVSRLSENLTKGI